MNQDILLSDTKRCSVCRKNKQVKNFYRVHSKLLPECKDCNKEKQAKIRQLNRGNGSLDTLKRCKICNTKKSLNEFYKCVNGYYRCYCKDCFETTVGKAEKDKEYKARETRRINERNKHRNNISWSLLKSARCRAKVKNLPFNITIDDIQVPDFCPILGIKIQKGAGNVQDGSPSIDRIIPEKGYTKGNIRVISWKANAMKRDGSISDFEKIIRYIKDNISIREPEYFL